MKAMVLNAIWRPLELQEIAPPSPGPEEVLIRVCACGVCRTDRHIFDGELIPPRLPLILGHQIVGYIEALGANVSSWKVGTRVGIPWLGSTCGQCFYCTHAHENLCDQIQLTGFHLNGGYAESCVAQASYLLKLPNNYSDFAVAPLLCAGLIGYRALTLTENAQRIGFYGFGSSAHLLTQLVVQQGREVYAFTRPGDLEGQDFARSLGAVWAGGSDERPLVLLDAALIFAPVGALIPKALEAVRKAGIVVLAGIHMSEIPAFSYDLLWGERVIRSVANLTRRDGEEFLTLAAQLPIHAHLTPYPLAEANEALTALKEGRLQGSAVLYMESNKKE